LVNTVVQND